MKRNCQKSRIIFFRKNGHLVVSVFFCLFFLLRAFSYVQNFKTVKARNLKFGIYDKPLYEVVHLHF